MKTGLLVCEGNNKIKNIGDYIQSVAAEQFINTSDYCFVEREALNSFTSDESVKVIMNGWFMFNPQNWPPAPSINPLFVSFHMVPAVADRMLSKEGIEYFKKYEPIGSRDFNTMNLLKEKGIEAYFSGCLTLTLDSKNINKGSDVIFVDPYYESFKNQNGKISIYNCIKNGLYFCLHMPKMLKLKKIFATENVTKSTLGSIKNILNTAAFYKSYSKYFCDEVLFNAKYISHSIPQTNFKSNKDKLNCAKELLNIYSKAKYVVTSRIHCALPCLGLKTPVMFVTSENLESTKNPIRSPGRFGGLINLFRIAKYYPNKIMTDDSILLNNGNKIDNTFTFSNKDDYLEIRESLISKCKDFYNN